MNHDCCSSQKTKTMKKGGVDPVLIGIVFTTLVLLAGAIFLGLKTGNSAQVQADSAVTLTSGTNNFDWGEVDYDGGVVTHSFTITNTSQAELKLFNVKTSCMCTNAQLKTAEVTSSLFGMHGTSEEVVKVKPGETAQLMVTFDPAYHGPSGVGPISRTVTLDTNDPQHAQLEYYLTAIVVKHS